MPSLPQQPFSLQGILAFLQRNMTIIVVGGSLATFWMLLYTFTVYKPSYSAKAVVIIKDSALTRRFVEPEQGYALQTTTSSSSNPVLNTMGILKSGAISKAVYEYFQNQHPEVLKKYKIKDKDDWDGFFRDGSGFIKAKNQSGTDLISIQFSWSNPRIAKEVLETVVKAFQNASRDLNKEEQVSRTHFLGRQVEEIEAQLEAIREQKSAFQSRMGTVNTDREGISLSETRLELSNRLNQIEAARRGKEEQLAEYEKVLGMTPEKAVQSISVGQNQTLGRLYEELYRLQQQYSQQLLSLGESHPTTQETFAQIIQMRANIRAEEKRTLGSNQKLTTGIMGGTAHNQLIANMVTVRSEVEDLRAQATKLRTRLGELDSQIRAFPKMAQELTMITQRENSLSMALDQLRQKVLEGKLKEEQTLSNVFVVDAPHLPDKPDFPTRSHLMVLSLVIGVLSGVSLAVLKEQVLFTEGAEAPAWLESIDEEESEHFQPSVTPVSVRAPRANGSRFSALVPASSPIQGHPLYATGPYGPQSQSKAPEVYAEVVDEDPRTRTIKDNPYMHAPGKKTGDLAAALRSVLRDYQDTHQ